MLKQQCSTLTRLLLKRRPATGRVGRHCAEQARQRVGAVAVKARPRTPGHLGHRAKGALHRGMTAFLEQEQRQAAQAALAEDIERSFQVIAQDSSGGAAA